MSGGEIAALVAAIAFVLLVLLLAIPLLKLGRTLDEATLAVRKTHEGVAPLLGDARTTIEALNTQLVHVEGIARNVNSMTTNVAAMTSVVSSTLGSPLIKAAAFTYGVRKTVSDRRDADAMQAARRKHRGRRTASTAGAVGGATAVDNPVVDKAVGDTLQVEGAA